MMRRRHRGDRLAVLVVAAVLAVALAGCTDGGREEADAPSPTATAVPEGWRAQQIEGLRVLVPEEFEELSGGATAEGVTQKYGVPYTDQTSPPPVLQVFVEQGEVGPLDVRAPLLVGSLEAELGIEIPEPQEVEVEGAVTAAEFTYDYRTEGGTTSSGTTLEPTDIRQSDLLVETEGLPKYGLRYAAPADQYDEELWRTVVETLQVEGAGTQEG